MAREDADAAPTVRGSRPSRSAPRCETRKAAGDAGIGAIGSRAGAAGRPARAEETAAPPDVTARVTSPRGAAWRSARRFRVRAMGRFYVEQATPRSTRAGGTETPRVAGLGVWQTRSDTRWITARSDGGSSAGAAGRRPSAG